MNWKRWMLGCAVLGALSCGDSENDGSSMSDDPIAGGDAGAEDAGTIDGGVRPDAGGNGGGGGDGGGNGGGDADGGSIDCNDRSLRIQIRDFKESHPDFEDYKGTAATTGLLKDTLVNSKPVFQESRGQITSATSFDQWYRDVPDVNKTLIIERTLVATPDGLSYEFWDPEFFPIDGKGWGNEDNKADDGTAHNYHFTTEIHTLFTYQRGQVFKFTGDDDLWIFVNNKLALDLGGLHSELSGTIDFDAQAERLGITPGSTYQMDIFHAERHTVHSRFRITTNIECFTDVVI